MKTVDVRLLAFAVFALALSLPVAAWLHGRSSTPIAGRYVAFPSEYGIGRMNTENGILERMVIEGRGLDAPCHWMAIPGQTAK